MKKIKKLKLNKETISELTKEEANDLKGGTVTTVGWPTVSTVGGLTMTDGCSMMCESKVGYCPYTTIV